MERTSFFFGGNGLLSSEKYDAEMNDLWWYSPDANGWTQKIPQGADGSPPPRTDPCMVWDGKRVILFGGVSNQFGGDREQYRNDLWWYDPASNTWECKIEQGAR